MPVISTDTRVENGTPGGSSVARVLLADDDLASRLTLKTILSTAGYSVDCAASVSEAVSLLEHGVYQLVLADLQAGPDDAAPRLLSYARQKEYHPATARILSRMTEAVSAKSDGSDSVVRIPDENVSELLESVATLISRRADRRMQMRQAG